MGKNKVHFKWLLLVSIVVFTACQPKTSSSSDSTKNASESMSKNEGDGSLGKNTYLDTIISDDTEMLSCKNVSQFNAELRTVLDAIKDCSFENGGFSPPKANGEFNYKVDRTGFEFDTLNPLRGHLSGQCSFGDKSLKIDELHPMKVLFASTSDTPTSGYVLNTNHDLKFTIYKNDAECLRFEKKGFDYSNKEDIVSADKEKPYDIKIYYKGVSIYEEHSINAAVFSDAQMDGLNNGIRQTDFLINRKSWVRLNGLDSPLYGCSQSAHSLVFRNPQALHALVTQPLVAFKFFLLDGSIINSNRDHYISSCKKTIF